MAPTFPRTAFLVLAGASLVGSGCGGDRLKTAVVRGTITHNGKVVPNGTIMFIPASGPAATGEIQPDGTYTLTTERNGDGAVLGSHKVVIVAVQVRPGQLPEERSGPPGPPIVPLKYTSAATTDLTAEVKDEENTIDFDLVDEKKTGRRDRP